MAAKMGFPADMVRQISRKDNFEKKRTTHLLKLFKSAAKLAMASAGKNVSNDGSLSFASPRFFSTVPDTADDNVSYFLTNFFR